MKANVLYWIQSSDVPANLQRTGACFAICAVVEFRVKGNSLDSSNCESVTWKKIEVEKQ